MIISEFGQVIPGPGSQWAIAPVKRILYLLLVAKCVYSSLERNVRFDGCGGLV